MAIEFPAALKLVKEIAATAKRLGETRDEFKSNEISIKLQRLIIDLHNEITLVQSGYQTVLRTQDELKKKLSEREQWEEISSRYRLERVGTVLFSFVYVPDDKQPSTEPAHWLCANCFEQKKKSILQYTGMNRYQCPSCKTDFAISGQQR
ncbi:MAG TPA: hypothetical protein VMH87_17875 [Pseudomonadales bacterium]|nr:hypothetical protein [Pseudomonadales bacterium]